MTRTFVHGSLAISAAGALVCALSGCSSPVYNALAYRPADAADLAAAPPDLSRAVAVFNGNDGRRMLPVDVARAIDWADVVVLGERHNDGAAHELQASIVHWTTQRYPGCAVTMEMLERDEQGAIDDYLADRISREAFYESVHSTKWYRATQAYLSDEIDRDEFSKRINNAGWMKWESFYQPIIDAAKENGSHVYGANTSRTYVRLARARGYEYLRNLPKQQRALFEIPRQLDRGAYRERFWETITGHKPGEVSPPNESSSQDDTPNEAAHSSLSDQDVAAMFRSQQVWDATMGDTIAQAIHRSAGKVLHVVGGFHSDFEGGTVLQVRLRVQTAKILTVSFVPDDADHLRGDDMQRADIVVYTGKIEKEQAEDEQAKAIPASQPEQTQPATQPATRPDDSMSRE